ncbi:hypothetical protein NliqN6_6558 [Naganishia liquefaciens]|uniref:Uncharacterized protein n=1 Tax=Naganishia liquefaciens TaxID=104408 RepID=A0A8H3U074_9TREE|nr:hypothetical protein NliqN6_6558 [Naganishia liquefaciens]
MSEHRASLIEAYDDSGAVLGQGCEGRDERGRRIGEMPEMESPGRNSEMSSSMCSTPGLGQSALPLESYTIAHEIWSSTTTPLFTPSTSPPIAQCKSISAPYTLTPPTDADDASSKGFVPRRTYSSGSEEDCDMDSIPMLTSDDNDSHDHEDSLSNISNSLQTSEDGDLDVKSSGSPSNKADPKRKRRSVRFCELPPRECVALLKSEYDRTPHPVVIRLTYRDILEMREMKVELGIVTKRQVAAGGGAGVASLLQNQKRNASPVRNLAGGRQSVGSDPDLRIQCNQESAFDEESKSPYATRPSEFPSSSRLLSRLQEMGEPQPPVRESGMGICVEPTFGLDKITNQDSPPIRGPSRRLARKTSGDFAVEESEFQKELRQARAELEMVAVQEIRDKNIQDRDRLKAHGLALSSPPHRPNLPSVLQYSQGVELERKPSLSIFSNPYPGVRFPDKNAASPYEPLSPTATATPTARAFSPSIHSPNTTPRANGAMRYRSPTLSDSIYDLATPPKAESPGVQSGSQPVRSGDSPDDALPSPCLKAGFRPPSPILAPFARSTALRIPSPDDSVRSSPRQTEDPESPRRPQLPRRESSEQRLIARFPSTAPRKILRPPSPILAPFARSQLQSIPSTAI